MIMRGLPGLPRSLKRAPAAISCGVNDMSPPRSTTLLPVLDEGHQSVPASPSAAFGGGVPDPAESGVAWPDSAQLTVGLKPPPCAACPDAACPGAATSAAPVPPRAPAAVPWAA